MVDPIAVREVGPGVSVAGQLRPEDMAVAARMGFRSIVNNRPDFEAGPEQPTHASIEAAARAAGLHYCFLPVEPLHHSPEQIAAFALLLRELPAPVLAFCRSGARSTRLFQAATAL